MDTQRREAYTAILKKLLAVSNQEEQLRILQQHYDLIDTDFVMMIRLVAEHSDRQQRAGGEKLRKLAQYLIQYIETLKPTQADWDFLTEVLGVVKNGGEQEQVHALLCQNTGKISLRLAQALQIWSNNILPTLETEVKKGVGFDIGKFSSFLQEFSLGNRADNIEIVITGYQIVLTIFFQSDFPEIWAWAQNNLGCAYRQRIRGEKSENIQLAIVCFQNTLTVYSQSMFPIDWARTQENLGTAYNQRIRGKRAENLECAIRYYEKALIIHTQDNLPVDWAGTQNDLGNTYLYRIRGERAENLERAIECFQNALNIRTQSNFPYEWAMTQVNLGVVYTNRIRGEKAENLERAIECFQNALNIRTQSNFPYEWAMTQVNLGTAYINRIVGKRRENQEKAIECFHNASTIFTQKDFPIQWASVQHNLGAVYIERIRGERAENLEQAIESYKNALVVLTPANLPVDWAMTQNNLGKVYIKRIRGERAENLERAIKCFQDVLTIRTQSNFPHEWARTQDSLGTAYVERIRGELAENIEQAIKYFQNSLVVHTKKGFPHEWAVTQNNLGNAYIGRIKENRAENIERAIKSFHNALTIFTQRKFPEIWARTQNNLGCAYHERIRGEKSENIEQAIKYYENSLIICTQREFPELWARTQVNLGNAYLDKIKGEKAKNLERAIEYCKNALIVYSQRDFPEIWAMIQANLGSIYKDLIGIEKVGNLEQAIKCYENALLIFTPQTNPSECLRASSRLGLLHIYQEDLQQGIDIYTTAIEAVEQIRDWASNDDDKQEIISNAIPVYQNIVQACINLKQIDKALEYVERSKARNLIDLLSTRDLYPKGNIPQEIITRIDELRKEIIAEERRLRLQKYPMGIFNNNDSTEKNRDFAVGESTQNIASDRTYLNYLKQRLEQLVTQHIQPIDPAFQLTQRVKPIKFEQIKATLPTERTALVELYIGDRTLSAAFIVTPNQSKPLHITYSAEQFSSLVETVKLYYYTYRQRDKEWRNNLLNILTQLAQNIQLEAIIEKIKEVLPNCDQVILVPHRWLHLLPIHALPLSNGKCLLDIFSNGVSYAPSVQLLELTQKQVEKNLEIKQKPNFFALQNPTQDLQFAEIEVKTIGKQFSPKDKVLAGKEAHKQALTKERLSKANLSHFSCHGSFNFENPELSALHLANSKVEEKTEQDLVATVEKTRFLPDRDGSYIDLEQCLTLGEIFGLDLRNCSLVTLSACETGLTDFKSLGDEYIGLPSGFLFAGSPNVVSSLWSVDDLSTTFLMIKFYQNLQEIDSVPISLNQAQLWLRNVTKEELYQLANNLQIPRYKVIPYLDANFKELSADTTPFASPYHWASFCSVGF